MRFRIWRLVLFLVIAATVHAGAGTSLRHAREAQCLLGSGFWSRIIRIENDNPRSPYPHTLHALVFELSGILWFYSDVDGTQSLSLYRNHVAEDKADLGPLLQAIDGGFKRWAVVQASAVDIPRPGALPKGCFVESVAAWCHLAAGDPEVARPMLLSFYADRGGTAGHTVLAYAKGDRVEVVDPSGPIHHRSFPMSAAREPLALARAFAGEFISRARVLPIPAAKPVKAAGSGWVGSDATPAAIRHGA